MAKRIAIVDRELCKPKKTGYACQRACPINRSGKECITVDPEDTKILIDEELCIGCGICVKKCSQKAITIVNLPEKLEENPIHRYGRNLFSLYRLPLPKPGGVVGLIGRNGTGKTTIVNILSGNLKPNRGLFTGGEEIPWKTIIEQFRGTELQSYMEKLSVSGIRAAFKPQHVDSIPKVWKGKVSDFLGKLDEKGRLLGLVKRLGAENILDRNISQLSGGELQLLAITATLLKEADFYFFDEPSSYLDVKERLLVAKEIRELAKKACVFTVEHDLAVADYLADFTHILYGKPGAFGIVSKPYSVRLGINTYLEGYVKEDNVRFRPEAIIFEKRAKETSKTKVFLDFPAFVKKFRGFELKTSGGSLCRGEVIGILGPNAIGKTTFIKILAGELKPDAGKGPEKLKLAYKPQRLALKDEENVLTLRDFLGKSGVFNTENKRIIRFLGLEPLLERRLGQLSGGELQAAFIASVLMQDKEIMLLDEPSAFLDVEQRLRVAKLLRNHVETSEIPCFVVDHDLLFVDTLSDRVMIFAGQSGKSGTADLPCPLKEGMNRFLKALDITYRRDPQTGRPRANKPGSQLDREQKERGSYYYE